MHAKLAVGHVQVASSADAAAEEKGAGCPLMKTREREREGGRTPLLLLLKELLDRR